MPATKQVSQKALRASPQTKNVLDVSMKYSRIMKAR